jgi:hypothetical protein
MSLTSTAYTTFAFSNLTIRGPGIRKREASPAARPHVLQESGPGMEKREASPQAPRPRMVQDNYYVSTGHRIEVEVTNTGNVAGAEVAQLYLSLAPQAGIDFPPQQLRGFDKVFLKPGESKRLWFTLRRKDVAYWNVGQQEWTPAKGKATLKIASSSRAKGVQGDLWVS